MGRYREVETRVDSGGNQQVQCWYTQLNETLSETRTKPFAATKQKSPINGSGTGTSLLPGRDSYSRSLRRSIAFALAVALHLCASPAWSQISKPEAQQSAGMINGTIVDDTGAAISGANVTLSHQGISPGTDVLSGEDGRFYFSKVSSGPSRSITAISCAGSCFFIKIAKKRPAGPPPSTVIFMTESP